MSTLTRSSVPRLSRKQTLSTTRRVVCPQLRNSASADGAMRWVLRLPGVTAVHAQSETAELVMTYDLRRVTLAAIRRHLQRGGVWCEGTLIQRCHLAAIDHQERAVRVLHGLRASPPQEELPLVRPPRTP